MENKIRYQNTNSSGKRRIAKLAALSFAILLTSTLFSLAPAVATSSTTTTFYPLTIQAGGGTFVNPLMQTWATAFNQYTGGQVSINYQAIGSGAGITGILANTFEFAGSDAPVSTSQAAPSVAKYGPLLQFPETLGGVAIFYNIPGVTVSLNLTGPIVADIYLGKITTWNDPAIQALNPKVDLPKSTIIPVHRSDGSGTTYALTNYFEKVSTDWNASFSGGCPCYGTSISWPSFEIGAKGSAGVAAAVQQNPNSIGYADSYYAFANHLEAAAIENRAGVFLTPSVADISAAAAAFSAQVQANPTFTITNAPGADSYPIATFTYILVWQNQTNQHEGYDTAYFFLWIVNQGQAYGPQLYYPELPANVVLIDQSIIQKIQYNGVPYITPTSVTVSCTPSPVVVGSPTACTAMIGGSSPKGVVTWTINTPEGNTAGKFSKTSCNSASGSCSVKYTPTLDTPTSITATYVAANGGSIALGIFSLSVNQATSTTTVVCSPSSVAAGSSSTTKCIAKVKGYSPIGTVTWSQSGTGAVTFSSTTCSLAKGSCFVTMTGKTAGAVTITAAYGGNLNNKASSNTRTLTVK
jgi:phosphate transport system substrate-binding protein